MNPAVDIVIPTCRTAAEVAALVDHLKQTAGCPCRVLATCRPISAAKNRNLGLDWAEAEYVVMVDDDMERFPLGWAGQLVNVLRDRPKCVMASPQLMNLDGTPGPMMGGCHVRREGVTAASERKLPTACVPVRNTALRFDEAFTGSGWEDDDYCAQLRTAFPDAEFLVCHDLWIVHRNEQKNQREPHWSHNKNLFQRKWLR